LASEAARSSGSTRVSPIAVMKLTSPGHSRAGAFAQIPPEIQAGTPVNRPQVRFRAPRQQDRLPQRLLIAGFERRHVTIWNDHQVASRVREPVQHHVAMLGPEDHALRIVVGGRSHAAKHAVFVLQLAGDVAITPRAPQKVHGGR
jgi:hypothetical protein